MTKRTLRLTTYALLIALALVLSYVESLVPAFFAVPGMKLGLTNIVVLIALYKLDFKSAFFISVVRIVLVTAMFGNAASLAYSIGGGVLSLLVMALLKKTGRFSLVAVSAAGGIFHNIGQVLVAMWLLYTPEIAYYMLLLWFSGIVTGLVVGLISALVLVRIPRIDL
ncbi:MAG: Gx transporter family protein [Pseudobutyrivibrio sp.]|nr:Gx transporter family protein [Pseudobutyrivibrio sp.]